MIEFLRQFRIGEYAIFDFTLAFLVMALLAPVLSGACKKVGLFIPKRSWIVWTLPLSLIVHFLFGAMTPMTVSFIDPNGQYLLKILIAFLTALGFKGVRRQSMS